MSSASRNRGYTYMAPAPRRRHRPGAAERIWDHVRQMDVVLIGCALALSLIGALLVFSATRARLEAVGAAPTGFLVKHLINLAIGLVLGAIVSTYGYRALRSATPLLYVGSVLGLVAVLAVGTNVNGAKSWIQVGGGFTLQPSEFFKVALVVMLAGVLGRRSSGARHSDVFLVLALAGVPMGLVMLQPDFGTTMVMGCTLFSVLVASSAPRRWAVLLVLAGLLGGFGAMQAGIVKEYQVQRFTAFLDPEADPQGVGYNTRQARIAIGAGGLTGEGLFQGTQTAGAFVPEQQTDFVFTVAGEELGFVGAAGIIVLMWTVLFRALRIAVRATDEFGRLLAVGIAAWFTFQAVENIGMTLGLMPVTGVPLPFVSYGGSSMFANLLAVGLLLNVHKRTRVFEGH